MSITMRGVQRGFANIIWVGLVLIAIVLINLIAGRTINRLDLTRDQRFTLSEPSIRAAQEIEGQVKVEVFFSTNLPPQLEQSRRDINDLLAEYAAHSDGKLTYQFIDPGANEGDRARADGYDLPAWALQQSSESELSVRYVYTGAALTWDEGGQSRVEIIPQILPGMNYEYEITRAVRTLMREEGPTTLGFLYGDGGMFDQFLQMPFDPQNPQAPEQIKAELENQLGQVFDNLYQFELVDIRAGEIPDRIKGLFVVGPTAQFDEEMKRRLDQYVMKGHPVAMFVSPYRQETLQQFQQQGFPPITVPASNRTGLEELLESYGVKLNRDAIIDFQRAQVSAERQEGRMGRMRMVQWIPFLDPRLPEITNIDHASVLVPNMDLLAFPPLDRATPLSQSSLSLTAEAVQAREASQLEIIEVLRSSDSSYRFVEDDQNTYESVSLDMLERYLPTQQNPQPTIDLEQGPFSIAMTLEGEISSALPGGGGSADELDDEEDDYLSGVEEENDEEEEPAHLDRTAEGRLLVVANGYWVESLLTGQDPLMSRGTQMMLPGGLRNTVQQYRASNILFLHNIADWLAQDSDLVRIRSRGQVAFLDTAAVGPGARKFYQVFNIAGIPAIFCVLGVLGYFIRRTRRARITQLYSSGK
ncbi:MAG: GldG family protein [Bradymonadales bacterium]|nr:GldG family protein [Bradymonadales bacterium]